MNGLPQLRFMVWFLPRWNAGFDITHEAMGFAIALGFVCLSVQWMSAAPRYSVCCISCGDLCELVESTTESVKKRAWIKGWLITESGEAFCQFCKEDQKPNRHVKELICRRYGTDSVKALNPNFEPGT